MKIVTVRDLVIGTGAPKIIVLLMVRDIASVKSEALAYREADSDVLEWRMDHYTNLSNIEPVIMTAKVLHEIMPEEPLLFIFRGAKEGDEQATSTKTYTTLNRAAIDSSLVDMTDLELFIGDDQVKEIAAYAHAHDVKVAISSYDSHKTPETEEIIARLYKMQSSGADISKVVLMPQSASGVLTLLVAALKMQERYADHPTITMSMIKTGAISRLVGEVFGPAATFGTVKKVSAPGQISVNDSRTVLTILHQVQATIFRREYPSPPN